MNFEKDIKGSFFVITGPCVVESETNCLQIADKLLEIKENLQIPIIFKASFRKANRTSVNSFSGIGDEKAIRILEKVKAQTALPLLTDIHEVKDIVLIENIDIIQIPAFLCRQTELIQAAAETMKPVNIKKGQFASTETMKFAIEKIQGIGNKKGMVTERGSFFGYDDLVVDVRNIPQMKTFGVPVIYDATHSVQQPGRGIGKSGGVREMIVPLCDAAMAIGADGLFIETHPTPVKSLSDAATIYPLDQLENLISRAKKVYDFRINKLTK
ncbi:MAG: 3-deoxy-8-phosphooctulonate synthase [Chitinophagales bacterium]|nr:3-deoxy-8-phosphooctulonate synthase [Chitinophagales bacterium]